MPAELKSKGMWVVSPHFLSKVSKVAKVAKVSKVKKRRKEK
jgi:hypothetical protein